MHRGRELVVRVYAVPLKFGGVLKAHRKLVINSVRLGSGCGPRGHIGLV